MYIDRHIISQLWNGKITNLPKNILCSEEYKLMLKNTRQRVVKGKFTTNELEFLKTEKGSYSDIISKFSKTFNKTVTKAYISKLRRHIN
jgi:hypothetical protein